MAARQASSSLSDIHIPSTHELHDYDDGVDNFFPIIYNANYDIHFFNLDRLHPFDCQKWGRIAMRVKAYFKKRRKIDLQLLSPRSEITKDQLLLAHSREFVHNITHSKFSVMMATEIAIILFLPMYVVRKRLLRPLKWQTAGSILAGAVALKHGWSINLGGGFHHCEFNIALGVRFNVFYEGSSENAAGFCLFADITLLIKYVWDQIDRDLKVMIVDLDAHQGNGHARDVLNMKKREQKLVYIYDTFNSYIYPRDLAAKEAVNRLIELRPHTKDEKYLQLLSYHINAALEEFKPNLVVYNAGTDILLGDPLGRLDITPKGVMKRDEIVFTEVRMRNIPIAMLTSGGYQRCNAQVISNSIENLFEQGLIQ